MLKKGYSILFSEKDNSIILSTKQLSEGEKVIAQISDGKIKATIEKVENSWMIAMYLFKNLLKN